MQGSQTLSQEIGGLTEGTSYWLQFYYNARDCCGGTINLAARLGGEELWSVEDVLPSSTEDMETYYFQNVPFVATGSSGLLEFVTEADGDATILLDAVNIIPRGDDEVVLKNPSFEASGSPVGVGYIQPANVAGWDFTSGGRGVNVTGQGPFSDNGSGLDQDSVLFIQNATSMTQWVEGFEPGQTYTLYYYVNARNCCGDGGFTFYSVSFDEELLLEEEVLPVGENLPYHLRSMTFRPAFADGLLQFDTQPEGDHTLLLDDIHIVKGDFVPPTPEPPVLAPPPLPVAPEPPAPEPIEVSIEILRLADGGFEIRWPSAAAGFVLQQTDSLGGAWGDVEEPVSQDGEENAVSLRPSREHAFFRLIAR